ncbi:hypothetical protein [Frankia sp. Cr2]|uniref:hypothetical protein n=1 Tax=Frankia sp. Cr2 TaxID=3073932 RepID=UPI002AD5A99D|nr:hypothetical protein [Frankia sp. Cr2]
MVDSSETVSSVINAESLDRRVAQIRLIPQRHGTGEHGRIFAQIARELYVPHLAPDFAYIHESPFYSREYFQKVYDRAYSATSGFRVIDQAHLAQAIAGDSRTLLIFRTIMGLTREEFSHSTALAGEPLGLKSLSAGKIDSMERSGTSASAEQASLAARTLTQIIDGTLFGDPGGGLRRKQEKPDTEDGWLSVQKFSDEGVPFALFLHQRHYGGAFRQILDATSTQRGDLLEDAVDTLFTENSIPFIRTGSHNQSEISQRFEVQVTPAPDFVVFDGAGILRAILECKGTNNGGTARDKALRFERLREESKRLGGIPLIAILGGMGWARVNDTLGPVVRDTEGRVFTLATLHEILTLTPFPSLVGAVPATA